MDELRADIEELKELRVQAKRMGSQNFLDSGIQKLQKQLDGLEKATAAIKAKEDSQASSSATKEVSGEASNKSNAAATTSGGASQPPPVPTPPKGGFVSISTFGFDPGSGSDAFVGLHITLEDVGTVKDAVKCDFKKDSFDLTVMGLKGKNYRLFKTNLENDIVPSESKIIIKANKIIVKLKKVKGDYSYDSWQNLTSKKDKEVKKKSKDDPTAGIMDMMKDMYDSGDDQMKKVIGEAMMKSRQGGGADASMGGL